MSIDLEAPRSRRALIAGAVGGLLAAVGVTAKPSAVLAGTDGDLALETTNTVTGSTTLTAATANPALGITGGAVGLAAAGAIAVDALGGIGVNAVANVSPGIGALGWSQFGNTGILGWSTAGVASTPTPPAKTGVYGLAEQDAAARGVFGKTTSGQGVRGEATSGVGVHGEAATGIGIEARSTSGRAVDAVSASAVGVFGGSGAGPFPAPIAASTGVYGISTAGHGVYGASQTGAGVYAANNASTVAAIVAEGGPGTAIHGHANAGPVPASPALTGIYGSAALTGVAVAADSASGLAVRGTSSAGHGIRGRGAFDGTIGESTAGRSGVVGFSGTGGAAPAGPAKTGVYGEATQDSLSRGVSGFSIAGQGVRGEATTGQGVQGIATTGQAVRGDASGGGTGVLGQTTTGKGVRGIASTTGDGVAGEATTGVGVRATATTGVALAVAGRATFSRSGKVTVPIGVTFVDVVVPGGLASTAIAFATLQYLRSGVYVMGARPNQPVAGTLRVYLSKALTTATPLAWFVIG